MNSQDRCIGGTQQYRVPDMSLAEVSSVEPDQFVDAIQDVEKSYLQTYLSNIANGNTSANRKAAHASQLYGLQNEALKAISSKQSKLQIVREMKSIILTVRLMQKRLIELFMDQRLSNNMANLYLVYTVFMRTNVGILANKIRSLATIMIRSNPTVFKLPMDKSASFQQTVIRFAKTVAGGLYPDKLKIIEAYRRADSREIKSRDPKKNKEQKENKPEIRNVNLVFGRNAKRFAAGNLRRALIRTIPFLLYDRAEIAVLNLMNSLYNIMKPDSMPRYTSVVPLPSKHLRNSYQNDDGKCSPRVERHTIFALLPRFTDVLVGRFACRYAQNAPPSPPTLPLPPKSKSSDNVTIVLAQYHHRGNVSLPASTKISKIFT